MKCALSPAVTAYDAPLTILASSDAWFSRRDAAHALGLSSPETREAGKPG